MAYIGNTVQNQGFAPAVDYFNGDGTTVTFTLSRPVASVAQLTAVIENVIQNPSTAFTVSGSSITFTSAPPSGTNNIWVEYTSLITTYAAISQDPTVIGDITATGGYSATGDYGNSFVDGVILDYVTGNARITTGASDGITLYNGGTASRSALMTITSAGNVGVGVTPSAWGGPFKVIEGGSSTSSSLAFQTNGNALNLLTNAYYNGTSYLYKYSSSAAGRYQITENQHLWFNAPSGTAGNAITFTQAMTLDASGNLGVGTTSPVAKEQISRGSGAVAPTTISKANAYLGLGATEYNTGSYRLIGFGYSNTEAQYPSYIGYVETQSSGATYGDLTFYTRSVTTDTAPTERMRIDSSGRVTTPYQPAFLAYRNANTAISAGTNTLPYDSTTYNIGSCYNTSTYRFTAPVAGIYQFNLNANAYSNLGISRILLKVNGTEYVSGTMLNSTISGDNNFSFSVSLQLSANDYVNPGLYVTNSGCNISGGVYWGSFSGYLVG